MVQLPEIERSRFTRDSSDDVLVVVDDMPDIFHLR